MFNNMFKVLRKFGSFKKGDVIPENWEETPENIDKLIEGEFIAKDGEEAEEMSVYDANDTFIRTYSLAIHGEKFKKLARQFARKIKGNVR